MHKYKVEFMHLKTGKTITLKINACLSPIVALKSANYMLEEIVDDFSKWLFVKMEIVSY